MAVHSNKVVALPHAGGKQIIPGTQNHSEGQQRALSLSQGRVTQQLPEKTTVSFLCSFKEHRERISPGSDQCLPDFSPESTLQPTGKCMLTLIPFAEPPEV